MALGIPVTSYPTPILSDSIETEIVKIGTGKYQPIPYGTPYNSVEHGNFPKDLPDHVLVFDAPEGDDGLLRRRIWVNNRVDQDLYNFQIDYEGNNPEYPIYTRTYVVRRDGYTPLPALSDDAFDLNAKLVSEKVLNDVQPNELGSTFIRVVRIFYTLPGQLVINVEYPYGGNPAFPRVTAMQKVAKGSTIPGEIGTACPVMGYKNAKLIQQKIKTTDNGNIEEITAVYEITPPIVDQAAFGYEVANINDNPDYPVITWEITAIKNGYQAPAIGSSCPIPGYEHLVLISEKTSFLPEQSLLLKIKRKYERLPGLLMYQVSYDNNDIDNPIVKTAQRRLRSTYQPEQAGTYRCPIANYNELVLFEQHMMPTDSYSVVEDQRVYEKSPNNIITTYDFDADLNCLTQTTRQKIASGIVPNIGQLVLALEEQPEDKWRTIQVITSLVNLPEPKVEYKTGRFPFPTLLTGIALQKVELTDATNSAVIWYPNTLRPLQNVPAVFRVTTQFFNGQPPNIDVFSMPTRDLVFRGRSFQIAINNVLCNEIALSVTFNGDTTYGDLTEGITFEATNPSATDYYQAIGSLQVTGCDIERYRGNIWSLQKTEVVLA